MTLDPGLRDALAKHAGKPWRGTKGDEMVSVKFDALAKEGIDPEAVTDDVLAAGGSLGERDAAMAGEVGIRRSKPLDSGLVRPAVAGARGRTDVPHLRARISGTDLGDVDALLREARVGVVTSREVDSGALASGASVGDPRSRASRRQSTPTTPPMPRAVCGKSSPTAARSRSSTPRHRRVSRALRRPLPLADGLVR